MYNLNHYIVHVYMYCTRITTTPTCPAPSPPNLGHGPDILHEAVLVVLCALVLVPQEESRPHLLPLVLLQLLGGDEAVKDIVYSRGQRAMLS